MNNFYPAATVILSEICLALLIACGAMLFLHFKNKRRDNLALNQLTEDIKSKQDERVETLKTMLKAYYKLDDDKTVSSATELVQKELGFYKYFMDLYQKRNTKILGDLTTRIGEIFEAYRLLPPQTSESNQDSQTTEVTSTEGNAELEETINSLRQENAQLSEQLQSARKELDDTIAQYASAYAGGGADAEALLNEGEEPQETDVSTPETEDQITSAETDSNHASDTAPETEKDANQPDAGNDGGTDFPPEEQTAEEADVAPDQANENGQPESGEEENLDSLLKDIDLDMDFDMDASEEAGKATDAKTATMEDSPAEEIVLSSDNEQPATRVEASETQDDTSEPAETQEDASDTGAAQEKS